MMDDFKAYGRKLLNNGYAPIPIKVGEKRPVPMGWSTIPVSEAQVTKWQKNLPDCGVGLRGGDLVALDMDIDSSVDVIKHLERWCESNIGQPMIRVGKAPKVALFYRTDEPFSRRDSAYYANAQHIEARSLDTQTLAFGTHPDTQEPYTWITKSTPLNTHIDDLPTISAIQIDDLYEHFDDLVKVRGWPLQAENTQSSPDKGDWMKGQYDISHDDLVEALSFIDAGEYHQWVRVGMALYHQFSGDDEGYDMWNEWSADSEKYDETTCDRKWSSFKEHGRRNTITVGSIFTLASSAGWDNPGITPEADEFPEYEPSPIQSEEKTPTTIKKTFMEMFSASRFMDTPAPVREWLIQDFIPLHKVCMITAPGGTGKSMFAFQMAVSIASGLPLAGFWTEIEPRGVLLINGEDEDDDMHERLRAIYELYSDDPTVNVDELLQAVNTRFAVYSMAGKRSTFPHKDDKKSDIKDAVDKIIAQALLVPNIGLIAFDPASRFRSGEENSQEDMTFFVQQLEKIRAATGATVIIVHHANKDSMRSGGADEQYAARGASALTDGVRLQINMAKLHPDEASKMGVKAEDAHNFVRMAVAKTNYTAPQDSVWFERQYGGLLMSVNMREKRVASSRAELTEVHNIVIGVLNDASEPLTRNELKKSYAGKDGKIPVAANRVHGLIDDMVKAGILGEFAADKPGGGKSLKVLQQPVVEEHDDFLDL